jgi:hypothetical protein
MANKVLSIKQQEELEQRIRARALQLCQQRGGANNLDVEDWIAAEQEILGVDEKAA